MSDSSLLKLRETLDAVLAGEATSDQLMQLEQHLLTSAEARDVYLDYINLHSELRRRYFTAIEESLPTLTDDEVSELRKAVAVDWFERRRRSTGKSLLFALAALAIMLILAVVWQPWSDPFSGAVATIRSLDGEVTLVSTRSSQAATIGDALRPGDALRVASEASRVLMQYPDGTSVHLHSGAVVKSPADQKVRLELLAGSMEVDAAKQSPDHPLVFATRHSRYVVLGTRFRLYQEEDAARLELDEGKVRLERPTSGEHLDVEAGSVAIAGDDETPVEVMPLSSGRAELVQTLPRAGQTVAFHGEQLLTSHRETGLMVWDVQSHSLEQQYRHEVGYADGLAATNSGYVVQLSREGNVLGWMPNQPDAVKLSLPGKNPRSRALSPNGAAAVISGDEGTKVYDIDLASASLREVLHVTTSGKAWCLAMTAQGDRLAAGFWDGTISVYAIPSGDVLFTRKLQHTPTHCDLSRDGQQLVVTTQRDGMSLIDLRTGEQKSLWPPAANMVRCLRFSDDGRRVLAGLNDRTARMWNVADGELMLVVEAGHSPQGIAWSEEKQLLATAEGSVKLWHCTFGPAKNERGR